MSVYTSETLQVDPVFDLELLMTTSQETRIGGDMMDALSTAWDQWIPHVRAKKITVENESYLLAWLDESVEEFVDTQWEESPSDAFMFNALAQVMCMGIVHALLPEVEEAGCAAAPRITDALADALEKEGMPLLQQGAPGLSRRYAVITYFSFQGGCEACSLQEECPKGSSCSSADGPASVTLPGYE